MFLYALDVAERHRGRGYGSALVRAFVREANDRGCTEVWVLTEHDNEAAIATYLSGGGRLAVALRSQVLRSAGV